MKDSDFCNQCNCFYDALWEFLIDLLRYKGGVKNPKAEISRQLHPNNRREEIKSKGDIWQYILNSSVNTRGKPNSIGPVAKLKDALFGFDPDKFLLMFEHKFDSQEAKSHFRKSFKKHMTTGPRWTPTSHWPQFIKTCLSSAKFLQRFPSHEEFLSWADSFDKTIETRPALPLVLAAEIHGLGYALACDFIKEIGYTNYGKPDTHTKDILKGLGFCPQDASDYFVQNQMVNIADNLPTSGKFGKREEHEISTYSLDKLIWLVGSGKFYKKRSNQKPHETGNNKDKFITTYKDNFVGTNFKKSELPEDHPC